MHSKGSKLQLIEVTKPENIHEIKQVEIIDQILNKHSIPFETPTKKVMYWQSRIIDEGYTKYIHAEMKQTLTKKIHINIAFGGSQGSYNEFEQFLKDDHISELKEKKLANKGKHPLHANEEDVRLFYFDKIKGTKAPVMPNNYEKLGTVAQVVFDQLKKKKLIAPIMSRDELILLVKKERGRLLTPVMAEKYVNEINEKFVEWYSKTYLNQGKGEGVLHRIAKKEVTHYSKQHHLSFAQTNEIGEKMEVVANKIEPMVGKAVAKIALREKSSVAEDLMGFIEIGCKIYQIPVEQGISFLINRFKGNASKKNKK